MFIRNKGYKIKTIFPNRDAKKFYNYKISYKVLWRSLLERLRYAKDGFILITGVIGSGKSTLIGKINFQYAEKELNFILNNGMNMFIPEKHYITDSDEFAVKMITEQGSSLWYDEAREGSNRQSWYDKINKAIKKRKNVNRKLFNIYWLCMPLETEFDPKLAAHLTMWIWVRRGVGEVYIANNQRKGGRGLNIDEILKREEVYLKENPHRTTVPPIIHKEYVGRIFFSKFSKEEDKKYNELVRIKSATGKLTEEEMEKFGIEVKKSPEEVIENVSKRIKTGEISDKMTAWEELKILDITAEKKIKLLNFHLGLLDMGTFNKVFNNKKKELSNLANKLKKTN